MTSTVQVARQAMATRFEVLLHGENETALRAAGEQALDEIERLEGQLSLFRPTSEIASVNRHAADRAVRVSPPVFKLLERARQISEETGGAFDISVAPLAQCWGFQGGFGRMPDPEAMAEARACVGMHLVELDEKHFSVRFLRKGVMLDLGAIGKGYAIDCAVEVLVDAGVTSALVHGGTSSSYGIGAMPDGHPWKTAISCPAQMPKGERTYDGPAPGEQAFLAVVPLRNESLSVSATWGKFFRTDGRTYGHELDPRSGKPAQETALAAVVFPSATDADALSTALLVMGPDGMASLSRSRPALRALLASVRGDTGALEFLSHGIPVAAYHS